MNLFLIAETNLNEQVNDVISMNRTNAAVAAAAIVWKFDETNEMATHNEQNHVVKVATTADNDFLTIRTNVTTTNKEDKDRNLTATILRVRTDRSKTLFLDVDNSNRLESSHRSGHRAYCTNPNSALFLRATFVDVRKAYRKDEIDFPCSCVLDSDTIDQGRRRRRS